MKFAATNVGKDLRIEIIGASLLLALSFLLIGILVYIFQLDFEFYVKVASIIGIILFVFVLFKTSLGLRNSLRELSELKKFQGCHFEVRDGDLEVSSFIMIGEEKENLVSGYKFTVKIGFDQIETFAVEPARRRVNRAHSPPLYKIILKSGKIFYVLRRVFESERSLVEAVRSKVDKVMLNDKLQE
jgi:hypothetical protein